MTWTCSRITPDRWKASPGLTEIQRAGIAAYEALIAQLRQVNAGVLAVRLWAGLDRVRLLLDGFRVKTSPSRLDARDLARPAGLEDPFREA